MSKDNPENKDGFGKYNLYFTSNNACLLNTAIFWDIYRLDIRELCLVYWVLDSFKFDSE